MQVECFILFIKNFKYFKLEGIVINNKFNDF